MKLLILVSFLLFICEYTVSAQSQQCILPIDTIQIQNVDNSYPKPNGLNDTIEYESKLPVLLSSLKGNHVKREQTNPFVDKVKVIGTDNSMPCYQPKGSFSMLICEPDTTINYTLLIKKSKN